MWQLVGTKQTKGGLACLITNQILDSVFKTLEDRKFKKDISSTCQNNLPKHGENKTIYRIHRLSGDFLLTLDSQGS